MKKKKTPSAPRQESKPKQPTIRTSQADVPVYALEDAERLAEGLWENFAGRNASPPDLALAIQVSPTSSSWRALTGSAIAYGLTTGGWNASDITLTPLGRAIVAPTFDGESLKARREALLKPRVFREFFQRYDRSKFPSEAIAINVLVGFGVPKDRAADAYKILLRNGRYTNTILETPSGPLVHLSSSSGTPAGAAFLSATPTPVESSDARQLPLVPTITPAKTNPPSSDLTDVGVSKIYISSNTPRQITNSLRAFLRLSGRELVEELDGSTLAQSFDCMRTCGGGILTVGNGLEKFERELVDVLRLGGAMAIFGDRVSLLAEAGFDPPSSLADSGVVHFKKGETLNSDSILQVLSTVTGHSE